MMSNREIERLQAEDLVNQLESHYKHYTQLPENLPKQRDFGRLFQGWFSNNEEQSEPVHQAFLSKTETLCRQLSQTLDKLEPKISEPLALRAAQLVLVHNCICIDRDRSSYLTAAEYLCMPLLPYLSLQGLDDLRRAMLARTPRRMMFPKQLEVLQACETLITKANIG